MRQRTSPETLPFGYGPALLGSFLVSFAISFNRGAYDELGILCLVVTTLIFMWRFSVALRDEPAVPGAARTTIALVWVGLFAMLWFSLHDGTLIMYALGPWHTGRLAQKGMLLLLVSYLPAMSLGKPESRGVRAVRFALVALCVLAAGIDTIKTSPAPLIDVWDMQMQAGNALLQGKNPYPLVQTHDTLYSDPTPTVPYLCAPLQVYLNGLSYAIFGEIRYAMLFAILLTGVLFRDLVRRSAMVPSFAEDAPALALWMMPKLFFIVEQAWVDPMTIAFLTLAIWAQVTRRPVLAAVLLGLGFCTKQTMVWAVLLCGFMFRMTWRQWGIVAGTTALVCLPFLVLEPRSFIRSVVVFQFLLPPRLDSLTLTNWLARRLDWEPIGATVIALLVAGSAATVAIWRLRAQVGLVAFSLAFVYLLFFEFNKWAHANYYYQVAALSALAAAASFLRGDAALAGHADAAEG